VRNGEDVAEAAIVVATLVGAVIDGYFAMNRLWVAEGGETLAAIQTASPEAASALRAVLEAPIERLCKEPELVENMVSITLGKEVIGDRLQPITRSDPPRNASPAPGGRRSLNTSNVRGRAPAAIRSYANALRAYEEKEAVTA
jgi:hypothetical protein